MYLCALFHFVLGCPVMDRWVGFVIAITIVIAFTMPSTSLNHSLESIVIHVFSPLSPYKSETKTIRQQVTVPSSPIRL